MNSISHRFVFTEICMIFKKHFLKGTVCLRCYFTAKSSVSAATDDIRYIPQKLENTKIKFYIRMILHTVFVYKWCKFAVYKWASKWCKCFVLWPLNSRLLHKSTFLPKCLKIPQPLLYSSSSVTCTSYYTYEFFNQEHWRKRTDYRK